MHRGLLVTGIVSLASCYVIVGAPVFPVLVLPVVMLSVVVFSPFVPSLGRV